LSNLSPAERDFLASDKSSAKAAGVEEEAEEGGRYAGMRFITTVIGNIASVQTGPFGSQLHHKDYVLVGTPIVTVEHLGKRKMTRQNLPCVSEADKNRLSKYTLRYGDLVFSRVGSVDRCSWVSEDEDGWMFSGRCLRVRPNDPSEIYHKYLYYFFSLESTKDFVRNIAVGATMPSINTRLLSEVPISFPGIEEQRQIGDVLSALDDRIEANTAINHHLEQIAQAIFKSWFVDFEPSKPFTEVVRVLGGGTPKTTTAEYWDGPIPFFTTKDMLGLYVLTTEKTLTEAGLNNCNSRFYPANTVFVTARGTVGKLTIAGVPMAMGQSCYALVGNSGYGQHFVYHLALEIVEHLKHKASGAVFDAIVTRDFESEIVPAPPLEAVNEFEDKVKPVYEAILNNVNESARLATLRDTLLPRLMSGELSSTEIGDAK